MRLPYLKHSIAATAAAIGLLSACGGSSSSPTPTPTPGPSGTTITITSSGASPISLEVQLGTQVTFVNSDSRAHNMTSDPHPDHTDCPEINQVGFLAAGQSRQTGNLVRARSCGYHDHDLPNVTSLQGTITIR